MIESPVSIPVALNKCHRYSEFTMEYLSQLLAAVSFSCDGLEGKTVLLKPNLVSARAASHGCTHPLFVRTVALYFLSRGCRVLVGDSPAFGSAQKVARAQGLTSALEDLDVEIINFDQKQLAILGSGHEVNIAKAVLDCDLFVNLPKIKAHGQMYVSLAVKNTFGIVTGLQKGSVHMKYGGENQSFTDLIVALQEQLPPQLIIGDGVLAMHKSGPITGEAINLGVVAASENAFAFDTAILRVLGLQQKKSPLWVKAFERGHSGCQDQHCIYPLAQPSAFENLDFRVPRRLNPIRFSVLQFAKSIIKRLLA